MAGSISTSKATSVPMSSPGIGTAAGANIDYVASLAGQVCTYTYQAQGGNDTIVYDAANGTVVTTYVP